MSRFKVNFPLTLREKSQNIGWTPRSPWRRTRHSLWETNSPFTLKTFHLLYYHFGYNVHTHYDELETYEYSEDLLSQYVEDQLPSHTSKLWLT